jgi:hypothetical protein
MKKFYAPLFLVFFSLVAKAQPIDQLLKFVNRSRELNSMEKIGDTLAIGGKDLKIGDSVAIQTNKGLFGDVNKPKEAFLLGLYQADGTQHKDYIMLDIWENDFDLEEEIQEKFNLIHSKYGCDTYEISAPNGIIFTRSRKPAPPRSPAWAP